jgi:hypothetical protein
MSTHDTTCPRDVILDTLRRARIADESHEMTARWAMEDLHRAGFRVVPLEPMPEMLAAWYKVKNGFHYHDEPPPADTSDVAAYRALVGAAWRSA